MNTQEGMLQMELGTTPHMKAPMGLTQLFQVFMVRFYTTKRSYPTKRSYHTNVFNSEFREP